MNEAWVVCKFGGTSVSSSANWDIIVNRVITLRKSNRVWITVSAVSQVTNKLLAAIEESLAADDEELEANRLSNFLWIEQTHLKLLKNLNLPLSPEVDILLSTLRRYLNGIHLTKEVSPKLKAKICAYGELISSTIGKEFFVNKLTKEKVKWLDARKLLFSSERPNLNEHDRFLEADVIPRSAPEECDIAVDGAQVIITQGFICSTAKGATALLGRGGSDTSGSLFAALLNASKVEIWTDVNGLFTTDPRFASNARVIREMSYREAQEMAGMGAKVLHPRCLGPAKWGNIPVEVWNTMDRNPEKDITRITRDKTYDKDSHGAKVLAVTRRKGQTLINLSSYDMWGASGFLTRFFTPFESCGISVDLITTSTYSVSVTLDHIPGGVGGEAFETLVSELKKLGEVTVTNPVCVVAIVGRELRTIMYELGGAMKIFKGKQIYLVSQSAEDLNLSFVVPEDNVDDLVAEIHDYFFPSSGEYGLEESILFGSTWSQLKLRQKEPLA